MLEFLTPPAALPGAEARMAVALIFTAAAAYFDAFRGKWVPNSLVYGSVLAALALNIIFFEQHLFLQASALFAAVFILTYPLYRLGQLGGADVYILSSIAAAIPFLPQPLASPLNAAPYPFILSVLVPTGLLFILHMLARFIPYVAHRLAKGQVHVTAKSAAPAIAMFAAFLLFAYSLSALQLSLPPWYFALLSLLAVSLFFFSLFKSEIKDSMVEMTPVRKLQEEDVLAIEKMDKGLVARMKLSPLLTAKSIALLRKSNLKAAPVYTGMPFFLPYLFLGLLFTVLFGDMLMYLLG